ncbi:fasciclin-like arabinogalactan protein 10 [Cajanus cajan]|uniref:Fasciclin-like arabinogalactan protein 10 n=1 Tax=Cajanus cajan TaxID=3821 RepID=A0A151TB66_CAJCA|nr:fasciclin-like arabinogalactan protein 10 [Cajanus cajan]KYP64275.1 Fasciclin-like arabinogalactan protein 10 [Cajanus cajan]
MAKANLLPVLLLLLSLSAAVSVSAHNITDILAADPDYSQFNDFLSQTGLADEINTRQTITVLVLNNAAFSAAAGSHPLSVVKNLLSLHILLDYFDNTKLHQITNGTTLSTTLYQTTGTAHGNVGSVNITDLKGGKVGFGSAAPGSKLDSTYTKSVKQIPYNISVIEISAPIIAPGILTAPPPSADVNITALIEKAGCKTFANLIASNGLVKTFQSTADKGLTIFAPNDEAFKAKGVPDLKKLTNAEVVSLLQYHAAAKYLPIGSLKTTKGSVATLASNGAGKFDFTVSVAGDSVTLHTGVDSSRIADTVLDSTPLSIYSVDSVLLPSELFAKSPSPAPAPEPASAPSPSPRLAPSPSPLPASPPAPAGEAPGGAPADAPSAAAERSTSGKSDGVHVKASAVFTVTVTALSAFVISAVLS